MSIQIRQETNEDHTAVYEVVKKAFEDMDHSDHDEHNLVNRLRKSMSFIPELSLVAVEDGNIVGHIMFTEIIVGQHTLITLAPISVLPEKQNKGIGSLLIKEGHQIAAQLGYKGSVVLGHDEYYPKFGYVKAIEYRIEAPFEVPDENFMAMELVAGGLSEVHGMVEYDKAFFEK